MPRAKSAKSESVTETVSKAEAVRRAIAAIPTSTPQEGANYVKEHFGTEMDAKTFSLNRSQQKARDFKKANGASKAKTGRMPRTTSAAMPSSHGETGLIEAMESLKPLVASLGVDKVKRLAELLG